MTDARDPLQGLRPAGPPQKLRERVLLAAREVEPAQGSFPWGLAAALALLTLANVAVNRAPAIDWRPEPLEAVDGASIPQDGGPTLAEQLDALGDEPAL